MAQSKTRAMIKLCPFCTATFKSTVALQAHAMYTHQIGFYTCAWCTELIEAESKVREHAKTCTELLKHAVRN